MREILFRGKRADNGEWVEGFYGRVQKDDSSYLCVIKLDTTLHISNLNRTAFEVVPETVGQFTGLTDKNGVKIFEGDVLGGCNGSINGCEWEEKPFYVKFQYGRFNVPLWAAQEEWDSTHYLNVIGNIHDNPELINK